MLADPKNTIMPIKKRACTVLFAIAIGCFGFTENAKAAICSWQTVSGVAFGTYNVFCATPTDSTSTITFKCNGVNAIDVAVVDLSRGNSSSFSPRYMLRTTEQLTYNLYMDSSRTSIWGDGTSGTSHYSNANPPNNTNVTLTIYGRITAGQDVTIGSYTDSITATLTF